MRLYENRATLMAFELKMYVSENITSCNVAFATFPMGRVVGGEIASVSER